MPESTTAEMMEAAQYTLRIFLRDTQKLKYSDFECLVALRLAHRMLWHEFANYFNTVPATVYNGVFDEDGLAHLPNDYRSLIALDKGYIEGFTIYGEPGEEFSLKYNLTPSGNIKDDIAFNDLDVAASDFDPLFITQFSPTYIPADYDYTLARLAMYILFNQFDQADEYAASYALRLSQQREIQTVPQLEAFP